MDGQAVGVGGAEHRVLLVDAQHEIPVAQLRVVFDEVEAGLHHAGRHAARLAAPHHVFGRKAARPFGDALVEDGRRRPPLRRCQCFVLRPSRLAHDLLECLPLRVRHAGDGHPAFVGGRIGALSWGARGARPSHERALSWGARGARPSHERTAVAGVAAVRRRAVVGQAIAARAVGMAAGEIAQQAGPGQIHAHLELGQVDALAAAVAAARFEGGQNGHRAVQAGAVVVVGKADADVLASGHARQVGEAGQRVDGRRVGHELRPRAAVAHAGHLHVDGLRVVRAHVVEADAPALEHANREVVDHHIRGDAQPLAQGAALRARHVQRQRPLVAVPHRVVDAVRRVRPGAGGGVHLHHVGAEIGQDARGEGAGQHVGEVEDAQTGQRPRVSFVRGGVLTASRRRRLRAARARRVMLSRRVMFSRRVILTQRVILTRGESLRRACRAGLPRRVAEAVGRAGAAHGDVAEVIGLPPSARFQLRILCHLVHRQHPAVGRVALLRLEEELLDVARRHPVAQRLHEAVDVGPAVGRFLVLRVEQILLRLLLDEPDQLIV